MPCEFHSVPPASWSIPIPTTVAIVAAVLLYLRGWRSLREGFPEAASGCRPAAFVGGMLVLWIVIGSPLSALDHALLTLHMVQHLLLMTVAAPLILLGAPAATLPRSLAPLYLFLATLPCDALSAFLAFCGRVVYPSHRSAHPFFGLSPLQDQECAGALMWFWVTIAYLLPAIVITLRMLSPST